MALINCPECGQEVSDRGTACPKCGYPLTIEPVLATFTLKRESKVVFCAVKYEVYLDYCMWGFLKNGEQLDTNISCGIHHLQLIDKTNMNKIVYESYFSIGEEGLIMSFSASMNLSMKQTNSKGDPVSNNIGAISSNRSFANKTLQGIQMGSAPVSTAHRGRVCPKCGGNMIIQTVAESKKMGCGTVLLYLFLAVTVLGLLVLIPLMLRKKTETTTYAVCQQCGHKMKCK